MPSLLRKAIPILLILICPVWANESPQAREMIADMVHLSAGHLSQIFRHHTGQPMPDYIRNVRLNNAIELMRSSRETLDHIARKSGFLNTSYFYRAFKRQFGVTPAEFRTKLSAS